MNVSDRISLIIKEKYLSIRAFSKSINTADTTIGNIISGKSEPGYKILYAICEVYSDISPEWLITGIGEMYKGNSPNPEVKDTIPIELYRDLKKQNEDLTSILKQCQNQIEELIKINKQLSSPNNGGDGRNDAPLALNAGCADVG